MKCSKCGYNVSEDDCFCEECGNNLKIIENVSAKSNKANENIKISPDVNLAIVSDIGKKHVTNQDSGMVTKCENGNIIIIVADGVSSSVNATNASATAVNVINDILVKYDDNGNIVEIMKKAILAGHKAVIDLPYKSQNVNIDDPETTIVVALKSKNKLTIGWVGDSRAYVITNGVEEKLTVDDSWVEEVVSRGELTREEATLSKKSHYITQALGMTDWDIDVHIVQKDIEENAIVLLCSDGLWNYLPYSGDIALKLMDFDASKEALSICEYMVEYANKQGGSDNITVAICLQ